MPTFRLVGMSTKSRKFRVWRAEDGDKSSSRTVLARDAEDAAESFAMRQCGDDPGCYSVYMDGVTLLVRSADGSLDQFRIHAEQTVVFHVSGGRR